MDLFHHICQNFSVAYFITPPKLCILLQKYYKTCCFNKIFFAGRTVKSDKKLLQKRIDNGLIANLPHSTDKKVKPPSLPPLAITQVDFFNVATFSIGSFHSVLQIKAWFMKDTDKWDHFFAIIYLCHPIAISTVLPIYRILYPTSFGSISNIKSPILTRPIKTHTL